MRPEYLNERGPNNQPLHPYPADLNLEYTNYTLLPPIHSDDALVRSYLLHFFVDAPDYDAYRPYVENNYLEGAFAEAKIVNGIGDQEKWFAMARNLQALRDRVDIDFAPTNKQFFKPEDSVSLDLYVKNVKTLLVKVYDINTQSYYKLNQRELGTDMPLDGLVANKETTVTYDDPPLRRVARHFDFPELDKKRGAYMIEFIGNGISSRALVIKGKLHYLQETTSAGQAFTILDEKNQPLPNASLWLAGHEYKTDPKTASVLVPFSNAPGSQPIVLQVDDFASFDRFTQDAENYTFNAAFHLDRESLVRGAKATVLIRPKLYVNGEPISLRLLDGGENGDTKLQKTTLTITSVDREGTPTSKEIPDFPLLLDRDSTYEFQVPDNLASISFSLRAQVRNLSQNKTIDLTDSRSFAVNAIDASDKIEDVFLSKIAGGGAGGGGPAAPSRDGTYVLDVRGKTGEPLPNRPVAFTFKHKDFKQPANATLRSDANGRITLGSLEDIAYFTTNLNGISHNFTLTKDIHSPIPSASAPIGTPIQLPYMGAKAAPNPAELSLLELRGGGDGVFYADRFSSIKLANNMITLDDLTEGDYSFRYKDTGENVSIHIAPGIVRDGWILAGSRFLQERNPKPLQITSLAADNDNLTIKLVNATKLTRVHVVATRYTPEFPLYNSLSGLPAPGDDGMSLPILDAQYVAGRNIGDEYRYILERKYAKILPGNSLARPGLILNPWSISKTDTGKQNALAGEAPRTAVPQSISNLTRDLAATYADRFVTAGGSFSNYDFLPSTSVFLTNLLPDDNGTITISRKSLGDRQQIQVLAEDLNTTVSRQLILPETALAPRDLRLKTPLDITGGGKHFTEQKQITIVQKDAPYSADDTASSALEAFDSVAKVYKLYATLSHDPTLAEFAFILDWPNLSKEQKQQKYSKYACHELNFFLSRKDPDFFNSVIAPYLKNKKDKTFMDHYLLKDDLSNYLKPSEYDRLNTPEQALLGERLAAEQAAAARHIKDRYDLLPPDIERFNYLFRTALQGGALDQSSLGRLTAGNRGLMMEQERAGLASNAPAARSSGVGGGMGGMGGGFAGGATAGGGRGGRGGAAPAASPAPLATAAAAPVTHFDMDGKAKSLKQEEDKNLGAGDGLFSSLRDESLARERVQQLYLKVDKTEEWAENNYYHIPIANQNANLIPVSAFWKDYANAASKPGFLSTNLAEPSRNFSEMMLALGVLDLPFASPKLDVKHADGKISFTAPGSMVVFHRETAEAPLDQAKTPILVSQNFFRASDRYTYVDNERTDKYIADEFLTHVVYGCQVVVTNPTSSRQKLDVLVQIPQGAIPVNNSLYTRGIHTDVDSFQSKSIEYYFYFPSAAQNLQHYPVQVARNEKIIAFTNPANFKVVDTPSKVDTTSWDYISQNGTPDQVTQFLKDNNIDRLNLDKIAWRMKDANFFKTVTDLLAARHVYSPTLWSYSILNNNVPTMREFLQKTDLIANNVGPFIDCKLLTLDPVERRSYQFLEYAPLINARAHKLGKDRQIVNEKEYQQYEKFLWVERYRPAMNQDDLMSTVYYLLLQDRIDEANSFFAKVDASKLPTQLQYDYFRTYLDFYTDTHSLARGIIDKYKDYPVDRWRNLFQAAGTQLDEITGVAARGNARPPAATITNPDDRNQQQGALAATAPNLDFKVESRKITLNYQNVTEAHVNYYKMDIELMFSQNPFLGRFTGQFSSIRPNETATLKLDPAKNAQTFDLPAAFANSNVMIEITADGITRSQAYYPNSLALQLVENYGQLLVTSEKTNTPLPKTYVKVYARKKNGTVEFYKDGYTDLRGRFEYASLSTNDLDNVDRFSILILSDTQGAVVREAAPPKQ
jgi:hypothetical protein